MNPTAENEHKYMLNYEKWIAAILRKVQPVCECEGCGSDMFYDQWAFTYFTGQDMVGNRCGKCWPTAGDLENDRFEFAIGKMDEDGEIVITD